MTLINRIENSYIISLKGKSMDTTVGGIDVAVIALKVAEMGELFYYLFYANRFEEKLARTYFRQLMSAVMHCHNCNVFHRDIK